MYLSRFYNLCVIQYVQNLERKTGRGREEEAWRNQRAAGNDSPHSCKERSDFSVWWIDELFKWVSWPFSFFLLHFVRLFIRCTSFSVPASHLKWIIGCLTLWTWMRIRSCQRCCCTWLKRARPRSASSSLSRPTTSSCLELSSPMSTGETGHVHGLLPLHHSLHFDLFKSS